jgi:hypothetical protein
MIVLTARERADRRGHFDVEFDGRHLLSSASPLQDSCRILLKQGFHPGRTVLLRRPDGAEEQGRIGAMAVGGAG